MVRAILEGRKTQTRRVVKPQPEGFWGSGKPPLHGGVLQCIVSSGEAVKDAYIQCPYGVSGNHLWVRESFLHEKAEYEYSVSTTVPYLKAHTIYAADCRNGVKGAGFKPSIHMPRNLSRITLEITDVRVQRVQDISEEDAKAEGVQMPDKIPEPPSWWSYKQEFGYLWDSINGKRHPWANNDWVWALTFKRLN